MINYQWSIIIGLVYTKLGFPAALVNNRYQQIIQIIKLWNYHLSIISYKFTKLGFPDALVNNHRQQIIKIIQNYNFVTWPFLKMFSCVTLHWQCRNGIWFKNEFQVSAVTSDFWHLSHPKKLWRKWWRI